MTVRGGRTGGLVLGGWLLLGAAGIPVALAQDPTPLPWESGETEESLYQALEFGTDAEIVGALRDVLADERLDYLTLSEEAEAEPAPGERGNGVSSGARRGRLIPHEPAAGRGVAGWLLAGALAVAGLVLLLTWFRRGIDGGARSRAVAEREPDAAESDDGETTATTLARRAREASARGEHAEAVRSLHNALLVWMEAGGLIRPRRGSTHRDYLRAAAPRPALHRALSVIAMEFDRIAFGRRPADAGTVARCIDALAEGTGIDATA